MKKSTIIILVIAGILAILGIVYFFFKVSVKNTIIDQEENVSAQWAKVESAYQRRADLIPNLVNTVKGYADFEQETLTQVIKARSQATSINLNANELSPENIQRFQEAQQQLSGALSRLLLTVERYPDLKANQNFLQLQSQLEGTENRIKIERDRYSDAVRGYNSYIRKFPGNLFADDLGAEIKGYFEADPGTSEVPDVNFND